MFPPEFETSRLILKPVEQKDIPAYEEHFVDYEVIRHLSSRVPWPYPERGVESFVTEQILPQQGKDHWVWGIFLKEHKDELIGVIELWRPGTPENRGFWLGKRFWGYGYMTEAVKPINKFAFEELGFKTLIFSNAKGNHRSQRIKEKTGARLLKCAPASFVDPQYTKHEIWELTKDMWLKSADG